MPAFAVPHYFSDHALATEQHQFTQSTLHYRLPLSKARKVNGQWHNNKIIELKGQLSDTLFALSSEQSLAYYREQINRYIAKHDAQMLFECTGRDCGSANYWANVFFKQRKLNGPDDKQYVWVYRYQEVYYTVYLIERVNKQVYLFTHELRGKSSVKAQYVLGENCQLAPHQDNLEHFFSAAGYFVLTVSLNSANAWQQSQEQAARCGALIQKMFAVTIFESLGLGAVNANFDTRVDDAQYILHRID